MRSRADHLQVWSPKKWLNPSLGLLASCTFHFVRLYVSSFPFQAHVQRAQMRAEEEAEQGERPAYPAYASTVATPAASGNVEGGERSKIASRSVQLFPRGTYNLVPRVGADSPRISYIP
jgi:hypothetical protein